MIRHKDIKLKIVKTAIECFNHYGFEKTSMVEITRAAGVSHTTTAAYFPNKEELLWETVKETLSEEKKQFNRMLIKKLKVLSSVHKFLEIREKSRGAYYRNQLCFNFRDIYNDVPKKILALIRTTDVKLLTILLERGILNKELTIFPVLDVAELFNSVLSGISFANCIKIKEASSNNKCSPFDILETQKAFSRIFINGLRYPVKGKHHQQTFSI